MTICERCGRERPDSAAICPSCGTSASFAQTNPTPASNYGPPLGSLSIPEYEQGYSAQQMYTQQPIYAPPPQSGYAQNPYNTPPMMYQPISVHINMPPIAAAVSPPNSAALAVEIILSLFGIYGVGWLMAGETTAGIVLLICSVLIYWPIMLVGTLGTACIGLVCLIPLAIGAVILNAILLNNKIKQKTAYIMMQPVQMTPPHMPY